MTRNTPRDHGGAVVNFLAAILGIALVCVLIGWWSPWDNGVHTDTVGLSGAITAKKADTTPTAATTTTPDVTAEPTDTASPATGAATGDCVPLVDQTKTVVVPLSLPASDPKSLEELDALRGSKVTGVIYNGATGTAEQLKTWLERATCDGFVASVQLNSAFNSSTGDVNSYMTAVNDSVTGKFYVGYNAVPNNTKEKAKLELLKQRITTAKNRTDKLVDSLVDLPSDNFNEAVKLVGAMPGDHADIVYLGKSSWGSVTTYPFVGQVANEVDGDDAEVGVQMYNAGKGQSTADEVNQYVAAVHKEGVNHVILYTEEHDRTKGGIDNGGSADNPDYIRACAEAADNALAAA